MVLGPSKSHALGFEVEASKEQFGSSVWVSKPQKRIYGKQDQKQRLPPIYDCQGAQALLVAIAPIFVINLLNSKGIGPIEIARGGDSTADALHPHDLECDGGLFLVSVAKSLACLRRNNDLGPRQSHFSHPAASGLTGPA